MLTAWLSQYESKMVNGSRYNRVLGHLEYDFRNIGKESLNVMSGHTHEALADH